MPQGFPGLTLRAAAAGGWHRPLAAGRFATTWPLRPMLHICPGCTACARARRKEGYDMKKTRTILTALLICIALVFTACGQAASQSSAASQPAAPASTAAQSTPAAESTGGESEALFEEGKAELTKTSAVFMTGSTGGVWAVCGAAAADIWQRNFPGMQLTLTPGGGVANMEAIQNGTALLAFGKSSSTVEGINGAPAFAEATEKVREVAYVGDEVLQIIVFDDSPIQSVADLKGKVLTTSQQGNTVVQMAEELLSCYDMTFDDMAQVHYLSINDSVAQMKDGQADCFIVSTSLPASAILELATGRKVRMIPLEAEVIEEMRGINAGYLEYTVKPGDYDFVTEDVPTLATSLHIAASSEMSEAAVYAMTKTLVENYQDITVVHVMFEGLTPEQMAKDLGIPLHPGAQRYYEEAGLI